ncbi:MAG: DUF1828 domain-containing protein [Sulfuritalea sp.]|nr:DUF1828 domain-containing protein [Sulfuritalea sp.]
MKLDICKDFTVTPTATGLLVVTPLEYDDHDHIVVYADRQASGGWRVHDNGDAALRLMFDSIDPDAPRIQSWLAEHAGQVSWNERLAQLECADVPEESLVFAAFKVAQSAAQMQAMTAIRRGRVGTRSLRLKMWQRGHTGGDTPSPNLFLADCLFLTAQPVAVIIAGSTERLLEAELAWSHLRQIGDPTRVIAVIEEAKQVGLKQKARADYFTDKTYEYRDFEGAFREAMKQTVSVH